MKCLALTFLKSGISQGSLCSVQGRFFLFCVSVSPQERRKENKHRQKLYYVMASGWDLLGQRLPCRWMST